MEQSILRATLELIAACGFHGLTIEGVAEKAHVAKTTIYRRWSSKADLVVAALKHVQAKRSRVAGGDFEESLKLALAEFLQLIETKDGSLLYRLILRTVGEAKSNPVLLQTLLSGAFEDRTELFDQLITRGKASGEIRKEVEPTVLLSVVAGAFMFHAIAQELLEPSGATSSEQLIDVILHGCVPATK